MIWKLKVAFVLIPFLFGVFLARSDTPDVTNPETNQVFFFGTTPLDIGWTPVSGAVTYKLKIFFNDTEIFSKSGIVGTAVSHTNTFEPGDYTIFVRSVNADGKGPWSDPVTFSVITPTTPTMVMVPGEYSVFLKAPAVFTWIGPESATVYLLKLAKYDIPTGKYMVLQTAWIPQPLSGSPRWRPPAHVISSGKWRWSITDYSGEKKGYTYASYFRVKTVPDCDYMVVDLSGGANASNYPVTHLSDVPVGGWTDEHKTTKLVMRKITAGTYTMGSPLGELWRRWDERPHNVTLTKAFYIGVFEVTQGQWELVMGNRPSYFKDAACSATHPVEQVSYYDIRENPSNRNDLTVYWPSNSAVNAASFMGKLRKKTGMTTFDLPTEAQWEYACRAGTTKALNSGKNLTSTSLDLNMEEVGRYYYNLGVTYTGDDDTCGATAKVASYLPNAWGLYDMHGNVYEWCLDWYGAYYGSVNDPPGAASGVDRVRRGGCWYGYPSGCRSAVRTHKPSMQRSFGNGFRVTMTLP